MGYTEEEARRLQDNVLGLNAKKQVGSDTPYQQMVEKNKAILEGANKSNYDKIVEERRSELFEHTKDPEGLAKDVQNSIDEYDLKMFRGEYINYTVLQQIQGFVLVPVPPMGAVRTTKKAMAFNKAYKVYCEYKDKVRSILGMQQNVWGIDIVAYIAAPKSYTLEDGKRKTYTKAERAAMVGQLAKVKPDWDNIAKGVQDACMDKDEAVGLGFTVKRYCADGEERMYVRFRKTSK
jgi:Holliday junction resolvase RusA-like endonuclease